MQQQKPRRFSQESTGNPLDFQDQPTPRARSNVDALSVIGALAAIAPGLSEVELRVCLTLAQRAAAYEAEHPGWYVAKISNRDLVAVTGAAKSSVQNAIAALTTRGHIAKHQGTAERSNTYIVQFLNVAATSKSGPTTGPGVGRPSAQGGPTTGPGLGRPSAQGGPITDPPPQMVLGMDPHARASIRFDIDSDSIEAQMQQTDPLRGDVWERIAASRPEHWDPRDLAEASRWIHGYAARFGRAPNPHPPDPAIVAQLLTVCGGPGAVVRLVQDLMADRVTPGDRYGWYLAVALQRVHGISPAAQRQARAALRVMRRPTRPAAPVPPPPSVPRDTVPAPPSDFASVFDPQPPPERPAMSQDGATDVPQATNTSSGTTPATLPGEPMPGDPPPPPAKLDPVPGLSGPAIPALQPVSQSATIPGSDPPTAAELREQLARLAARRGI